MKQRAPIIERLRNFEEGGFKILPASNDMLQKKPRSTLRSKTAMKNSSALRTS